MGSQLFDMPLLRLWDCKSGSQPDEVNFWRARAPRERLDTSDTRKKFLTIHTDHKRWEDTPFISFTSSPAAILEMAAWRAQRRGPQTLTVIDPNI